MSKRTASGVSTPFQPTPGVIAESVGGYSINFDSIRHQLRSLKGEILTVIDASMADPIQRKAIKDLARKAFRDNDCCIWEMCGKPEANPYESE